MLSNLPVLEACPLFVGMSRKDLESLLPCLAPVARRLAKGAFAFVAGEKGPRLGVVVAGAVNVVQDDFWGNRTILTHVTVGGMFGEAVMASDTGGETSVQAATDAEVVLFDGERLLEKCSTACAFHVRVIKNFVMLVSRKNIELSRKIEVLTRRSTREKLLAFLSDQSLAASSSEFDIPFTRQELAEYLAVDRSAMSHELSKMRDEGLLEFRKNHFSLRHS
ncbi:MAG: Crp/Fnr family transcriptional regulator [Desulfovibrio sp.]|jgi:CRP-like cAMP-binding protein|nr:Crp/Fnr family transcriptional regulator [Desulfovibrio sp.]